MDSNSLTGSGSFGDSHSAQLAVQKDEFVIEKSKTRLIREKKEKIENLFQVQISFGVVCEDESLPGTQQWIEIGGDLDDRHYAKEYIKSLCNPEEAINLKFPVELEHLLSAPEVIGRIEKQSRAVLNFSHNKGEVFVLGHDSVSTTLALSALEDLISQHMEHVSWDPEQEFPKSSHASKRLDQELRRLSSEEGNMVAEEHLGSMNDAIKRAILDCLKSTDLENKLKEKDDRDKGRLSRVPETIVSDGFIDIQNKSRLSVDEAGGDTRPSLGEAARQLKNISINTPPSPTNDSANLITSPVKQTKQTKPTLFSPDQFELSSATKDKSAASGSGSQGSSHITGSQGSSHTLGSQGSSVITGSQGSSIITGSQGSPHTPGSQGSSTITSSLTSTSPDLGKYLREFALQKGYTNEEVDCVFLKHGYEMRTIDFWRALKDIKSSPDPGKSASESIPTPSNVVPAAASVSAISTLTSTAQMIQDMNPTTLAQSKKHGFPDGSSPKPPDAKKRNQMEETCINNYIDKFFQEEDSADIETLKKKKVPTATLR